MKFCYCCGAHLPDDFTFCPNCGKQQPQLPAEAQPAPQVPVPPVCAPVQQPAPSYIPQPPVQEPVPKYISQPSVQSAPQYIPQAPVQNTAQSYQAPVNAAPVYMQPQPVVNKSGIFLGKAGLGLGIASLVTGVFFILMYIIIAIVNRGSNFSVVRSEESISITLGVIALILSGIARKRGNYEKTSLLGLIFGIVGIVLGVIGFIVFLVLFGGLGGSFSGNIL